MNPNDVNQGDRTSAFEVKKIKRRNDSVAWIVASVLFLFLNVVAIGRITIVGQFIDDIIFTFAFGWFKYAMYLIFIGINVCIYFGIRFRFKRRFLLMIFATWCVLSWIISAVLFICAYHLKIKGVALDQYISKDIFIDSVKSYVHNWKKYSFLGDFKAKSWFLSSTKTYFSLWAGGGFIGSFFSGVFSYSTIYGDLVFSVVFLFFVNVWIFTGDPLFLLKPKSKRSGRRLRILSLGARKTEEKTSKKHRDRKRSGIVQIEYFDAKGSELDIHNSQTYADITIEMPGFKKSRLDSGVSEVTDVFSFVEGHDINNDIPFGGASYTKPVAPVTSVNYDQYFQNNNQPQQYNQPPYQPQNINSQQYNEFQPQPQQYNQSQPQQQQQGINYTEREIVREEEDFPISKFGNVPVEKARKEFEKETAVTPFGANGRTMEIFKKNSYEEKIESNSSINNKKESELLDDAQMTIEDFIADPKNNVVQPHVPDYESPLQKRLPKNNFATGEYEWTDNFSSKNRGKPEVSRTVMAKPEFIINKSYKLPKSDLLNPEPASHDLQNMLKVDANEKAAIINSVFESFNAKAKVTDFLIGPSITQFIVNLDPGSKVQSILNLENEIKLRLATQNILVEAPISGKAAVGIEIPNRKAMPVNLISVIGLTPLQKMNSKLLFPIGKSVTGDVIFGELSSMPHLLVAGSTGSGKSVMINSIIISILMRAKPHEVKMLLVDPKRVELSAYSSVPHLLAPIISDMAYAAAALKKVVFEMERRYTLFSQNGVKNIIGYNELVKKEEEKLPYFVVIIDELADLMLTENKKSVEEAIMRLTQMARAAGIHLILATQRPSTDVITGVIKANIPSRISFAVANQYDSRTILDSNGAEKLAGRGDLLFIEPGNQKPLRAQGIYVSDDEITRITNFCAQQQEPNFDETYLNLDSGGSGHELSSDELDPMYEQAIELIANSGQASTSYLQRKLRIGYNRASRIIDQLEENGLIGPQNGAKSRDIYIKN